MSDIAQKILSRSSLVRIPLLPGPGLYELEIFQSGNICQHSQGNDLPRLIAGHGVERLIQKLAAQDFCQTNLPGKPAEDSHATEIIVLLPVNQSVEANTSPGDLH